MASEPFRYEPLPAGLVRAYCESCSPYSAGLRPQGPADPLPDRRPLAVFAADLLNSRVDPVYIGGTVDRDVGDDVLWRFDGGYIGFMDAVYWAWREANGLQDEPRPRNTRGPGSGARYAVLRACGSTAAGRALFERSVMTGRYPGIVNGASASYCLRREFRCNPDPSE